MSLGDAEISLQNTLECGQVFHWQRVGGGYAGAIGATGCYVEQRDGALWVSAGCEALAAGYFALDHPLGRIYRSFPKDPAMKAAMGFARAMRIVRQPAWECLATFITSALKQVAHIAQISLTLRARYGQPAPLAFPAGAPALFAYPGPERLAALSEADLRSCALGFRAKNLLGAARMVAEGRVDLEAVARLDDDAARAELCRLPGVGEKVANCALLFGFGRLKAFPVDVWIERILRQIYFPRTRNPSARELREFSARYFGPFGGYAQQYLFHHARLTWPRHKAAK